MIIFENDVDTSSEDYAGQHSGLSKYWRVLWWHLVWVWRNKKVYLIILTIVGGVSTLLQGAVLGGLFSLVNSLKVNQKISFAGLTFDFFNPWVFTLAMAGIGLLLVASGLGWFLFKRIVNRLSVDFEKDLFSEIFRKYLIGHLGRFAASEVSRPYVMQLLSAGSRLTGRSLRVLLISLLDFIRVLLFFAVCMYLQPVIMLVLLLFLLPIGLAQYKLNRWIHNNEESFAQVRGKAKNNTKRLLNQHEGTVLSPDQASELSRYLSDDQYMNESLGGYYNRIKATEYAELLGHLGLTLALVAALAWLLFEYLNGGTELANITAFLFALRFFLLSGKSVLVSLAVFTRHFGQVREVYEVVSV